jgi:hypothetical protein
MQRSRFFCLLTLMCFYTFSVSAQDNDYRPNFIPPSPDASALGKYGECEISLASGTIPITVPIYTVNDGGLTVPVNLSYYASGNKIDEAASFVGLGFTLNAGGLITRSVRNLPDDYPTKGFIDYHASYSTNYLENDPNRYTQWLEIANGCADAEPDAYFFNFNGYTGSFSLQNFGTGVFIYSKNDWKVQMLKTDVNNPKRITGWKFTGDDGIVYTFAAVEQATILGDGFPCQAGLVYNSAWYLTNITSPNGGRSINFTYEAYSQNFSVTHSVTQRIFCYANPAACQSTPTTPSVNLTQMTYAGQRIKTITTSDNGTTVTFNYNNTRTDEPGTNLKELDEVVINNKDNAQLRKFALAYDYSTGRLTLKSLQKVGTNEPPYLFTYNSFYTLPPRTLNGGTAASYGQDHWGYYNGQSNNTNLLAAVWKKDITNPGSLVYYPGGDRKPSMGYMQAGMLTKITFPEGGSDEYRYEGHDYGFIAKYSLADLGQHAITGTPKSASISAQATPTQGVLNSQTVTVSGLGEDMVDVKIEVKGSLVSPGEVYVDISNAGTDPGTSFYYRKVITTYQAAPEKSTFATVKLPKDGQYLIRAYAAGYFTHGGNPPDRLSDAFIKISWTGGVQSPNYLTSKPAGGLRIASVTTTSNPGDPLPVVRAFWYKTDANGSSGVINEEPKYDVINLKNYTATESGCSYDLRIAQNKSIFGYGPAILYRTVTEQSGTGGTNGKTVYSYNSTADNPTHTYDQPPYQLTTTFDNYAQGATLNEQSTYKRLDKSVLTDPQMNPFQLVNTNTSSVSFFGGSNFDGIKISFDGGANTPAKFHSGYYRILYGIWHATNISRKEYSSDGLSYVETVTNRSFFHQYLTDEKVSYGTNLSNYDETEYYYPADFQNPTTATQSLVAKNMTASPLEIVKKRVQGSNVLYTEGVLRTYMLDGSSRVFPATQQTLQLPQPSTTYTYAYSNASGVADARYVAVTNFEKYDTKENLIQITGKDGITTSSLWDKHNSGPDVKATGAASDKIAWSGFENTSPNYFGGTWTLSGAYVTTDFATGKQSYNGTITVNTTGFLAQNYTLSFWMKGGTPFTVNGSSVPATTTWTLYETKITGGSTVTINTQGGLVDEVRIYPVNTQLVSFAYDQLLGINTATDAKSKPAFYETDNIGRLRLVKDQNKDIVKRLNYEYDILAPAGYTLTATQTGSYTYLLQIPGGSSSYTYEWDFDDLSTVTTTSTPSITHVFPSLTAAHQVKVKIRSSVNVLATPSLVVTSIATGGSTAPCNEIQNITTTHNTPTQITFDERDIVGASYFWDFGDGVSAFTKTATHTYASGNYSVNVTVTAGGKACTASTLIKIN